jgi:hypothetical protein
MSDSHQEVGRIVYRRFFMIALLSLIVVIAFFSSLSYLNTLNIQKEQEIFQLEQDDFKSQYSHLQADYRALQNETNDVAFKISELQSFNDDLISEYQILESQYIELLSQYSDLQLSYEEILNGYQNLDLNSSFDYLVFTDGRNNYYAKNGATGVIDFSGSSATQVIQRCVNALSDLGGRLVFAGKLNLDGPIIIQNGASNGLIELCGLGPSTQLIVSQGSDGIHIFGDQAFGYGGPYHVSIRDLVLTTEFSPQGNFMDKGIHIKNWFGVNVENVMVFYANHSGIFIEDSANIRLNNVLVEGCSGVEYGGIDPLQGVGIWLRGSIDCFFHQTYSDTNDVGFVIDSNPITYNMPRNIFLSQCVATLNERVGIQVYNSDGIVISESLFDGSNNDGIMIVDSYRVTLVNNIVIGNVGNGIVVTSENVNMIQSEIIIRTSTINSNSQNGIFILSKNGKSISHLTIEACTIINSGTGARGNPNQPDLFDGIKISGNLAAGGVCEYIRVLSCDLGNREGAIKTQRYGINSQENTDFTQVFHSYFFDNIAGNYSLSGFNNSLVNNFDT